MATKRVIAVDLDGPCYEWDRTAQYLLRTYRGQTQLHERSSSWDWIEEHTTKEHWQWLWTEGVKKGLFRYGHMTTGCRVGLDALVKAGNRIVVVTHRPSSAVVDTIDWVSLYFKDIPLAGLHILSNGESKTDVDADVLIDDKPANLVEWADVGRLAVQFVLPHNEKWGRSDIVRAKSWAQVVSVLTEGGTG